MDDYEWLCTIGHFFSSYTIKNIYVNNVKLEGDIVIPNGVPYISSIFDGFEWIKTLTIASPVSYITSYAFQNSTKLESVVFMEGVKKIGSSVFMNCTSLRTINIPNSLTYIDGGAFENCPALMDVQSFITEPFPTDGFTNGQYLSATLTVPHGTKAKYMAVDGWKNFANIQERDGGDSPEIHKCATPIISVASGKIKLSCETENVTFKTTVTYNSDSKNLEDEEIILSDNIVYHISVYATKEGYVNSETVTKDVILCVGTAGDANADGKVDVADITHIVNFIVGKVDALSREQKVKDDKEPQ